MKIQGKSFYIRSLSENDLNQHYLSWLQDPEVNRYLEVRFNPPGLEEAKQNLQDIVKNRNYFCGIFDKFRDKFIGTITLSIDHEHAVANYGYLIGDKKYWGTPAAFNAIALMLDYAFHELKLRKVCGRAYINNLGSIFNHKRMGFVQEGRQRQQYISEKKPVDAILFGILEHEWFKIRTNFSY